MYTIATLDDMRRHLNLSATDTAEDDNLLHSNCRPPAGSSSR